MAYTRQNVWELGKPWEETLLWYSKAVGAMQGRRLEDKTSWRFYAAIHGFHSGLWQAVGYLKPGESLPGVDIQKRYWQQCQHGSWYFLPWHRGYLLAFEATVRAVVVQLGGPSDWTLPYWDYFKANQDGLPPEFGAKSLPDNSPNPLFVNQRYGPYNDGRVFVVTTGDDGTNLKAMGERDFTGVQSGGSRGFGGIDTGFEHSGTYHGGLESAPHDDVHGMVGGGTPDRPGLMSYPQSAGLDPIFWLHHANIDRLWEVWRRTSTNHTDPIESRWLQGPPEPFVMPMPDGSDWRFTPEQMAKLANLNYTYSDLSPEGPTLAQAERLLKLGVAPDSLELRKEVAAMKPPTKVELLGANRGMLQLTGTEARVQVELHPLVRKKVITSLEVAPQSADTIPDRIFLNLENVRGTGDATRLKVYVAAGDAPDEEQAFAGTVSLFGLRQASEEAGERGGQGLSLGLEITDVVDALHLNHGLDSDKLDVKLVPVVPVPEQHPITIGRISVSRQGQ